MTLRNIFAAAAMTSATALSAFAADDNIMVNGHTIMTPDGAMDSGEWSETYSVKGRTIEAGDSSAADAGAEGTTKDLSEQTQSGIGTLHEQDVILKAAETGAMVRTVNGEMIGTVYETQDIGDAGHLVFVDVAAEADLPIERLGFTVDTLSAVETGDGLEYEADMADLRRFARDHFDS